MGKLFLKLWLFLLATSYTSYLIQTSVYDWTRRQIQYEQQRSPFLTTTAETLMWALKDIPPAEWPARFADLSSRLSFQAELTRLDSVESRFNLAAARLESLGLGNNVIITGNDGQPAYGLKRLKNTDHVLVITLSGERGIHIFGWLSPTVFTWLTESTLYGTAVLLWLSLFWRDLKKLGSAAEKIGNGNFQGRVDMRRGSALRPLADSFNRMSERIAALITSHIELTNAVSHELRTPLARMRFALSLAEETDDPEERKQRLQKIHRDISELDTLTSEMLTYSRLDRDLPNFAQHNVPLDTWLPQIIEAETEAARAQHITLLVQVSSQLAEIPCEPKFMARAVGNLLRNALRFAKSRVAITIDRQGQVQYIHVDDDGPGIAEADRGKLFRPFARLDESRARTSGGTGLGLAIVQRIAQRHNGYASIETSPLGGARFTISWMAPNLSANQTALPASTPAHTLPITPAYPHQQGETS
ncbi:MAG: HAMP domain-containing protein [Betaproteobacteria bacterium]|nr:HAMP domain-containing protein [Betaproteobacteria bacterium]